MPCKNLVLSGSEVADFLADIANGFRQPSLEKSRFRVQSCTGIQTSIRIIPASDEYQKIEKEVEQRLREHLKLDQSP